MSKSDTVTPNGPMVARLRGDRRWTQETLAQQAGYSKSTIERIERGLATQRATLADVAEAFGVALSEIAQLDDTAIKSTTVLPPFPPLFVGRSKALDELKRLLQFGSSQLNQQLQAVVRGWPGLGKTTLSSVIAHDGADAFSAVLWTSLGQSFSPQANLQLWYRAVFDREPPDASVPVMRSELISELADRRVLLVIDDVWKQTDALPFLVGGRNCSVLYTTRLTRVAEVLVHDSEMIYTLGELESDESLELFRSIAPQVAEQYSEPVAALLQDLEGHPLAIHVAARLLKTEQRRHGDVAKAIDQIQDTGRRLLQSDVPGGVQQIVDQATPTVAAVLTKSTDLLSDQDRERFAILGAMAPKPATFDRAAIDVAWSSLAGDESEAQESLNELLDLGLVEPVDDGRYQMHALLVMHAITICGGKPSDFLPIGDDDAT